MKPLTQRTLETRKTSRSGARKRRSLDAVVASYIRELATAGQIAPKPAPVRDPQGC
jgi:hypothetical protein